MILFMAMPFIFALFNIVVPLQIGARDVAFPYLNAISFWLFFFGAFLLNISFVIGGSPNAGWTSYPPLSELGFSPGPGENFYLLSLQISGIGSIGHGDQLPCDDFEDARSGHDPIAHAAVHVVGPGEFCINSVRVPGFDG